MGSNTTNYGLIKPSENDYYNIEDFNKNSDVIDSEIKRANDRVSDIENRTSNVEQRSTDLENRATDVENKASVLENNLYNPNLLINSNFKTSELVNQRGESYYNALNAYSIDMWKLISDNNAVGLELSGEYTKMIGSPNITYFNMVQIIENMNELYKNKITLSAMVRANVEDAYVRIGFTVGGGLKNYYIKANEWTKIECTSNSTLGENSCPYLQINGDYELEIQYFKMEVGEIATAFIDDDMATKLAKCQRYLQVFNNKTSGYLVLANGECRTDSHVILTMDIPHMRIAPTLIYRDLEDFRLTDYINGSMSYKIPTTLGLAYGDAKLGKLGINAYSTGFTVGNSTALQFFNIEGSYLLLSAEL